MLKINFVFLILCVVCVVNGWRVFPLPDALTPATPVRAPAPLPISTIDFNRVKPTPVVTPLFNGISTTADNIPNKYIKPTSVTPQLSTQDVSVPSSDLLPPKTEYTEYEP